MQKLKTISDEYLDNRKLSDTRRFEQMSNRYFMLDDDHAKEDFELTKEQYDRVVAELDAVRKPHPMDYGYMEDPVKDMVEYKE